MTGLIFYMHDGPKAFRFELSGSLAGTDVNKIKQAWRTAASTMGERILAIDVTFLKSIDEMGRELILEWMDKGARLIANSPASRMLVESVTGRPYISHDAEVGPTFNPSFTSGALRTAFLALLAGVSLFFPTKAMAGEAESAVLVRYNSGLASGAGSLDKQTTSIEIDAAMPKLDKQARVEAIRRLTDGKARYQYTLVQGDSLVRNEMIARYLAIGAKAAPVAVPVTKSNYKFRFVGMQGTDTIFQITPRHKKQGMIAGVLWIDNETGLVTHVSGRLVKSPSVLMRRIDVSQNMEIRDGVTQSRETHLHIETRFTGGAEMNIRERVYREEVASNVAP